MSKALIIIELDDEWLDRINATYKGMFADITLYKKENLEKQCDYAQRIYKCWCPVKPIPEKLENIEDIDNIDLEWAQGWNDCISEILGEKE